MALQIICSYFESLIYCLMFEEFKNTSFSLRLIYNILKRHIKILHMPSISRDTGDTAVLKDRKSTPMPWICSKECVVILCKFRV